METYAANGLDAEFYLRSDKKEIDLILQVEKYNSNRGQGERFRGRC
ncbi:MAG: hypothetical protein QXG01_00620 [Candidatus Bathyarchaeia archaeon]